VLQEYVPTAPHTVANVLNMSKTTTASILEYPRDASMGAPRAAFGSTETGGTLDHYIMELGKDEDVRIRSKR
jgi:hypothetical protein